jgi:hypothetical protein
MMETEPNNALEGMRMLVMPAVSVAVAPNSRIFQLGS